MGWDAGRVAPATVAAVVAEPKSGTAAEPVSERLLRSLPYPDRRASLPLVRFAPDGRLIVGGEEAGAVQVFDPNAGKELRTVETPHGVRYSNESMRLSPDANTLFVGIYAMTAEPFRDGDTKGYDLQYAGEIRVYDLATGRQREPLRAEPRRGVLFVAVSPDGARLITIENHSGRYTNFAKRGAVYLWDVTARTAVKLRDGDGYSAPRFSADGTTVFVVADDFEKKSGVLYAYSAATGREVGRWDFNDGFCPKLAFGADGRFAAAGRFGTKDKPPCVQLYDAATLKLRAALAADAAGAFENVQFSPDGHRLVAANDKTVYLWDVAGGTLLKSWKLDIPGQVWHLTFSPDGQRLAASTWFIPPGLRGTSREHLTPQDYPQPKVFLIDVTADTPEMIVCPHGWSNRPAFSPDGKLLAVGGTGATHVFDVGRK